MGAENGTRQAKKVYSRHVLSKLVKDNDSISRSNVVAFCLATAAALITFAVIAEKANFKWVNF